MREAFLPGLPADELLAIYGSAPGKEIESGKFFNPESSAFLVANTFGFFLARPGSMPPLPGCQDCGSATSLSLECELRFPWAGGRHPCLDAVVGTGTALIGVESKRYEPFRAKAPGSLSKAYWRPVWGPDMAGFQQVRDGLRDGTIVFRHLDAAQLVKHALGLRTAVHRDSRSRGRRAVLLYLHADPAAWPDGRILSDADRARHRAEVEAFAAAVAGDEVAFRHGSYGEWLGHWPLAGNPHPDQAAAIRSRFFV